MSPKSKLTSELSMTYSSILENTRVNKELDVYAKERGRQINSSDWKKFIELMETVEYSDVESERDDANEELYSFGMNMMEELAPITKMLRIGANREFMEDQGKMLYNLIIQNCNAGLYDGEMITEKWMVYLLSQYSESPLGKCSFIDELLSSRCKYLIKNYKPYPDSDDEDSEEYDKAVDKYGEIFNNLFSIYKYDGGIHYWQDLADELEPFISECQKIPVPRPARKAAQTSDQARGNLCTYVSSMKIREITPSSCGKFRNGDFDGDEIVKTYYCSKHAPK